MLLAESHSKTRRVRAVKQAVSWIKQEELCADLCFRMKSVESLLWKCDLANAFYCPFGCFQVQKISAWEEKCAWQGVMLDIWKMDLYYGTVFPLEYQYNEVQAILLNHGFQHGISQFSQDVVFLALQNYLSCSHISPANNVWETMKNSLPVTITC